MGQIGFIVSITVGFTVAACNRDVVSTLGEPCGGNQHASAHAVLPDTGINAGRTLLFDFIQAVQPNHEQTELTVQQAWPAAKGTDPEPDPRVRLVTEAGQLLFDTLGTRYDQPTNRFDRPTWILHTWLWSSQLRTAFYEAFRDQTLFIELWKADASGPGTKVRVQTDEAGVYPVEICL